MVLFMIEIERLGMVVSELQAENEMWRQQILEAEETSSHQMNEFKRQYEQVIRPQIEQQIKNATGSLEADKKALELQSKTYQAKIADLENTIKYLQSELLRQQQVHGDSQKQLDEWKLKHTQLERGSETLKYTIEAELRTVLVYLLKMIFV